MELQQAYEAMRRYFANKPAGVPAQAKNKIFPEKFEAETA